MLTVQLDDDNDIYIYTYIYIYTEIDSHTYTHTYTYIYCLQPGSHKKTPEYFEGKLIYCSLFLNMGEKAITIQISFFIKENNNKNKKYIFQFVEKEINKTVFIEKNSYQFSQK